MKKKFFLIISIFVVLCSTGCSPKSQGIKKITDCSGDVVEVPLKIDKVICVDQSCCAFLVSMGLEEKLIGVHGSTLYSSWTPIFLNDNYASLKKYGYNPSAEAIYEAQTDLVILNDANYAKELRSLGVPAIYFGYKNMEELFYAVDMLGEIFGGNHSEFTTCWKKEVNQTINSITSKLVEVDESKKRNVYYINASNNPSNLYSTFGGNSFVEEWINIIGANLITSSYENINSINSEEILKLNPDTIIIGGYAEHSRKEELITDPLWKEITAVLNNEIFLLPTSFAPYEKFSVELPLLFKFSVSCLFPDMFDFDFEKEMETFYKEFYNLELTKEQLNYLVNGLNSDGSRMD